MQICQAVVEGGAGTRGGGTIDLGTVETEAPDVGTSGGRCMCMDRPKSCINLYFQGIEGGIRWGCGVPLRGSFSVADSHINTPVIFNQDRSNPSTTSSQNIFRILVEAELTRRVVAGSYKGPFQARQLNCARWGEAKQNPFKGTAAYSSQFRIGSNKS